MAFCLMLSDVHVQWRHLQNRNRQKEGNNDYSLSHHTLPVLFIINTDAILHISLNSVALGRDNTLAQTSVLFWNGACQASWGARRGLKILQSEDRITGLVSIPLSEGFACLLVSKERIKQFERNWVNRPRENRHLLIVSSLFFYASPGRYAFL